MKKLSRKTLKYFARMAAESYVNDPVHVYATGNENTRKKFVYHFMLERLSASNGKDIIYIDEQNRGMCVWRDAHNNYSLFEFLACPNWVFLVLYLVSTAKTLKAFSHLDTSVFEKNTLLIEPVFVDVKHQHQGVATKLIERGIRELIPQGYKLGLETQNSDNVGFYEKLGFKTVSYKYFKAEKIHNYYMVYDEG